jgi:hypothetical protein
MDHCFNFVQKEDNDKAVIKIKDKSKKIKVKSKKRRIKPANSPFEGGRGM